MVKSKRSADTDISQPWTEGNQAWWDWYVGLAVNHEAQESIQAADPLPKIILPSDDAIIAELHEPYSLSDADIGFFKDNGYIKLKGVLSPGAVLDINPRTGCYSKSHNNKSFPAYSLDKFPL